MRKLFYVFLVVVAIVAIAIAVRTIKTPVITGPDTDISSRFNGKDTGIEIKDSLPHHKIGQESEDKFDSLMKKADYGNWKRLPIGQLMGNLGLELRGLPYISGTLDNPGEEVCVVDLTGLDCVTFFENVLGMSRIIKMGRDDIYSLLDEVEHTRYRGGKIKGYASRLHYTSDWIYDNVKKGVVKDITKDLGGLPIKFKVGFMSRNPHLYPSLRGNRALIPVLESMEDSINARTYYYIPSNQVRKIENKLKTGDIIAITTNVTGLDYSHTGMIYKDNKGVPRFLHASQTKMKVILDRRLSEYLKNIKKHTGITILRPLEPQMHYH